MAQRKWNVEHYDFGSQGMAGYGQKDIDYLKSLGGGGPTPFQYRQLYQRAQKEGLNTAKEVRGWFDSSHIPGVGNIPRQRDVGHDYGRWGGWGFGTEDLRQVTGGNLWDTDHLPQVEKLRNWAWDQGIGVGGDVDEYITKQHERLARQEEIGATTKQLEDSNAALLAMAQREIPVAEPPKPEFRGAGGHFVPGTTRFQGQARPTTKGRSTTLKSRFGRMGSGFQSALSIAGGAQGATSSKVLNV